MGLVPEMGSSIDRANPVIWIQRDGLRDERRMNEAVTAIPDHAG
jgi:hypothetical protein